MRGWFITGTDTGVGKTWVSVALLHGLRARGLRAAGMKPVASGCLRTAQGLRNEDAVALQRASSVPARYEHVNPYAFESPVAPHVAAQRMGAVVHMETISATAVLLEAEVDALVVEGVGGWRVPLGPDFDVAQLAAHLNLPVILVVGLRLGCINHALLTAESITGTGLRLAGWVANPIDAEMEAVPENLAAITDRLTAPLLGVMPYLHNGDPRVAAHCLDLDELLK